MRESIRIKIMVDVGRQIKYIRETYDVTQTELSEYLKLSKSSISHYETLLYFKSSQTALLNQKYNYSINWIIEKTENKKSQRKTKDFKLSLLFFYNLNKLYTTPL